MEHKELIVAKSLGFEGAASRVRLATASETRKKRRSAHISLKSLPPKGGAFIERLGRRKTTQAWVRLLFQKYWMRFLLV